MSKMNKASPDCQAFVKELNTKLAKKSQECYIGAKGNSEKYVDCVRNFEKIVKKENKKSSLLV